MNHQRHVIREAVCALLASGATDAGTRVIDHPYDPIASFPTLTVVDVTEQQQPLTMPRGADRVIERLLVLEIAAVVHQVANHARQRDQLLAQVEVLLASAAIAGVRNITPAGYAPQSDHTSERPISIGRQRFEILYFTPQGEPASTAL